MGESMRKKSFKFCFIYPDRETEILISEHLYFFKDKCYSVGLLIEHIPLGSKKKVILL